MTKEELYECPCCQGRHPKKHFIGDYCLYCYRVMTHHDKTMEEAREVVQEYYRQDYHETLRELKGILQESLEVKKDD